MFTILGRQRRFCDGIARRDFLTIGALGAGLSLADLLHARAAESTAAPARTAKSAILIWLYGGPSHIDMYDMKPQAPAEFRGAFTPIQTSLPGVDICEHLPLQARLFDKLALLRSCTVSEDNGHNDMEVTTGFSRNVNLREHHPAFGSVLSKLRGGNRGIPPYVNLRQDARVALDGPYGVEPGFLGASHRPYTPGGPDVDNLRLGQDVSLERLNDRKALLREIDGLRRDLDAGGTMGALDSFAGRAFEMVTSGTVRQALDLAREAPAARDRYRGVEQFLTARRLVEAGVGCVTLSISGWDTHSNNWTQLKNQLLPALDRGFSNLIQDLHDRGLENDVVTVLCGEMGRTPRINPKNTGRDHWVNAMSVVVAGGGLKMGQVIGATDARAEFPKERPYRAAQVLSTVYHALGIDPATTLTNAMGRPVHLLEEREPVRELLG